MSKAHTLKCWPEHYAALTHPNQFKRKLAEIRLNDQKYEVGDALIIHEWDPETQKYTNHCEVFEITHILSGGPWLAEGYVMLSVLPITTLGVQS